MGDKRMSDNPKVPRSNTVAERILTETATPVSRRRRKAVDPDCLKNSCHLSSSSLSLPTHKPGAHVGITLKKNH
ncbi:hypothetical protein LSTR_LSTR008043 [Laodelphax striatellus]|uniref:Uncharacterized protein n=1 Tax=Laodelphax striatellus TaxID=195883 RepID=A0A482XLD9_LAOST|nr:hypothetical protein LSTR_LSTR008043 [Laodelphax striatellus]